MEEQKERKREKERGKSIKKISVVCIYTDIYAMHLTSHILSTHAHILIHMYIITNSSG